MNVWYQRTTKLGLLNVLPLPLFIQLNDLLLSKLYKDIEEHKINLPIQSWNRGQVKIKLNKTQTAKDWICLQNCYSEQITWESRQYREIGLKNRIINLMWWSARGSYAATVGVAETTGQISEQTAGAQAPPGQLGIQSNNNGMNSVVKVINKTFG